jgi:hypothetical protein
LFKELLFSYLQTFEFVSSVSPNSLKIKNVWHLNSTAAEQQNQHLFNSFNLNHGYSSWVCIQSANNRTHWGEMK